MKVCRKHQTYERLKKLDEDAHRIKDRYKLFLSRASNAVVFLVAVVFIVFFWRLFFWSFSGKFGEICAKILCTPKNLPAPTPMVHISRLPTFFTKSYMQSKAAPLTRQDFSV